MRSINRIIVHCAATKPSQDIGAAEIRDWHVNQNGWPDIGYHGVIRLNGTFEKGRPEEVAGAHARGHNRDTLAICLVGGLSVDGHPANTFREPQFETLRKAVEWWLVVYDLTPRDVLGHRDLPGVGKACPSFDVQKWITAGMPNHWPYF